MSEKIISGSRNKEESVSKQDIAEKVEDYLFGVADAFDNIKRIGSDTDDPEGSRYIIVSDSMANKLSHDLRNCAHKVNEAAEEKSPWIPVSERLPEGAHTYIVSDRKNVSTAFYNKQTGNFVFPDGSYTTVTHWMPLPPLPE